MFNQYAVYCQINIDGTAITLSQSEQNAVQYDPKSHSAIAMLYRKKWVEVQNELVDYENAHMH